MRIQINTSSGVPIYRQICDQIKVAIATGKVAIGDRLPSVRALSETLVINPTTVQRAYLDLETTGVIQTRRGQGTFVRSEGAELPAAERRKRAREHVKNAIAEVHRLGLTDAQARDLIDAELRQIYVNTKGEPSNGAKSTSKKKGGSR